VIFALDLGVGFTSSSRYRKIAQRAIQMGYVKDNLIENEHIKYEAKTHWIAYASYGVLALLTLGVFLPLLLIPYIRSRVTEMAVTNKRVVLKQGLIRRKTLELRFSKIEQVSVDQGIFGRILGYGNIKVCGTGGSLETFEGIADPMELRSQIYRLMDQSVHPPAMRQTSSLATHAN
jgi:uncharacterized membrane protein YdbT with pleckstrin-like domain